MGHFITRTAPDVDLYIMWSTVVDAPIYFFENEEALRSYLQQEYDQGNYGRRPEVLIKKTNETGSSVFGWKVGTWEDEDLPVREGSPLSPSGTRPGCWYLPRENQTAYAQAILANNDELANSYLVFREWEE